MSEFLIPSAVAVPVRILSFWAAVTLPFLYLPLLLSGIETDYETVTFLCLLVLNVLALVGGRTYGT